MHCLSTFPRKDTWYRTSSADRLHICIVMIRFDRGIEIFMPGNGWCDWAILDSRLRIEFFALPFLSKEMQVYVFYMRWHKKTTTTSCLPVSDTIRLFNEWTKRSDSLRHSFAFRVLKVFKNRSALLCKYFSAIKIWVSLKTCLYYYMSLFMSLFVKNNTDEKIEKTIQLLCTYYKYCSSFASGSSKRRYNIKKVIVSNIKIINNFLTQKY